MNKQVKLTFSSDIIAEPIIYTLGKQFDIITNILQAEISKNGGWILLDLEGEQDSIEKGLVWAISRGVRVI